MNKKDTQTVTIGCTSPIFLIAGLVLLILKMTTYPTISWYVIIGVGFFPLWVGLAFIGIVFAFGGIVAFFALLVWLFVWCSSIFKK